MAACLRDAPLSPYYHSDNAISIITLTFVSWIFTKYIIRGVCLCTRPGSLRVLVILAGGRHGAKEFNRK